METFYDFTTFKLKIKTQSFPKEYIADFKDDCAWFDYIITNTDQLSSPSIHASVMVSNILEITSYINSIVLPPSVYNSLITSAHVSTTSEINILALCKPLCTNTYISKNMFDLLCIAVIVLENYISLESLGQDGNF